jgi:hypothetical protein
MLKGARLFDQNFFAIVGDADYEQIRVLHACYALATWAAKARLTGFIRCWADQCLGEPQSKAATTNAGGSTEQISVTNIPFLNVFF